MNDTADDVTLELTEFREPTKPRDRQQMNGVSEQNELRDRVKKLRIGGPDNDGNLTKGSTIGRIAWLPWLLTVGLSITWGFVAIRTYRDDKKNQATSGNVKISATTNNPINTNSNSTPTTNQVVPGTIQLEVKGYLVPNKQITVSPIDVGGKVLKLHGPKKNPELAFEEGVLYELGDIIAEIDPASYTAARDEAKASLKAAEMQIIAAEQRLKQELPSSVREIEYDQVEAEIRETAALFERADQELKRVEGIRGATSIKEYQQAVADKISASARLERLKISLELLKQGPRKERIATLEAEVEQARANMVGAMARLEQATWRVENCTIRAPITGTVLTKKAEVGNLVNPMAFNGGGGICDLADLANLEVDLEIAEKDISKLKVGQKCRIKADAYSNRIYAGRLDRIMPIAKRANSTVNVRVKVTLPEGEVPGTYLKPEMGAVVSFLNESTEPKMN